MTAAEKAQKLNQPMLVRLRRCAADTSSNWDGAITVYPPEARGLVDLIDTALNEDDPAGTVADALEEFRRVNGETPSAGWTTRVTEAAWALAVAVDKAR